MPAPQIILDLIERFERNQDVYKSSAYNETQVRREFIDPFFEALGWDVNNTSGHAEAYKDVIHEDVVKVSGVTKAPDYSFRIGGQRKFFVEAKQPSINIKDTPAPAFQVRRYAWSGKLPLSIVTDFDEFAVYDCRIKPDQADKSDKARIKYYTYQQYAEKWDEIAAVFSKDAILKGSFDKYAESSKVKRGTAEVDSAFLAEIESWREALARNIALRNSLSVRELNDSVQRVIDRIIFLRIAEDRGIEDYGALRGICNGSNIYGRLQELFEKADDRYNSGLFHFRQEKDQTELPDKLTPNLIIDDKPLKDILKTLYYPDSPYEFAVLPADILGQVYEQFLGKVIRLTSDHRAVVEDKPEVKKAGGVFYTPTYIVEYIVQNTVGKLLDGKTPKKAESLRILDPACGSGSFLLGAYQHLLDWHLKWYVADGPEKHTKAKRPALYSGQGGAWHLTTAERKRILLNNIYGVDIDSQAVEVTKLSLLLKVLEDETGETLNSQRKLFHERALPNLGGNIKCGNSLIGPDFYDGKQMNLLDPEEAQRINVFDWQAEFPEIFKVGGFDAVIGNPPYVNTGNDNSNNSLIDYFKRYNVSQYKIDLFHLFIQRGIDLIRKDGKLGFIVPNTWLTLQYTDRLRKYILDHTSIFEIIIFDYLVFKSADVHTALIFLEKYDAEKDHKVQIKIISKLATAEELKSAETLLSSQLSWKNCNGYIFETRIVGKAGVLINKLLNSHPRLDQVARASLGCQAYNSSKHTQEQIKNRVFHASKKLSEEYLPELAGKDVSRYIIIRERGEWIKYGSWLHDYRTMDWLTGPRILIREISGQDKHKIQACYAEETYCNYKTILNVNPSSNTQFSMMYLLGILNSRLISFLYPYVSNKMVAKSFPRLSVGDLKKLPIREIDIGDTTDKKMHDRMVELVEQMLTSNKQLAEARIGQEQTLIQRQIDATDKQIDKLVYELYELTEDEIKIVEGQST